MKKTLSLLLSALFFLSSCAEYDITPFTEGDISLITHKKTKLQGLIRPSENDPQKMDTLVKPVFPKISLVDSYSNLYTTLTLFITENDRGQTLFAYCHSDPGTYIKPRVTMPLYSAREIIPQGLFKNGLGMNPVVHLYTGKRNDGMTYVFSYAPAGITQPTTAVVNGPYDEVQIGEKYFIGKKDNLMGICHVNGMQVIPCACKNVYILNKECLLVYDSKRDVYEVKSAGTTFNNYKKRFEIEQSKLSEFTPAEFAEFEKETEAEKSGNIWTVKSIPQKFREKFKVDGMWGGYYIL